MTPLRIGLLGASRIAPRAIIEPARARSGEVEVVAIAARELSRAKAYAEAHAIPTAVEGYEALVEREDVDVVYCALPPSGHLEPCLRALAAGKALLVEKPFARNAEQARRIAEAAARAGRPALEAFHYRFHPLFRRAVERVRSGVLGRIVRAEGRFDAPIGRGEDELRWRPELGGGGTLDLGCYVVHALRTLVGAEPKVRSAEAVVEQGVDAALRAQLLFPGGIAATTWSDMRGERLDWIELEGEQGRLRLQNFVSPQRGGLLRLSLGGRSTEEAAEGPGSYDHQLDHLLAVVRDGEAPLTGGEDAVANMAVLDAMRRAAGLDALL